MRLSSMKMREQIMKHRQNLNISLETSLRTNCPEKVFSARKLSSSKRPCKEHSTGWRRTRRQITFLTMKYLTIMILGILAAMISLDHLEIRLNAAHAIPWALFSQSRQEWSLSMDTWAISRNCHPSSWCNATTWMKAVTAAGQFSMDSLPRMLDLWPRNALLTLQELKAKAAQTTNIASHTLRLLRVITWTDTTSRQQRCKLEKKC